MNTESCDMTRMPGKNNWEMTPGEFDIVTSSMGHKYLHACFPGGHQVKLPLQPVHPSNQRPSFAWDGNEAQPTLTTEVKLWDAWHGRVTAGRMVAQV